MSNAATSPKSHPILERMMLWIVFNIIVALLPFAFRAFQAIIMKHPVSLKTILLDGELLLVTGAIAAGAVGELLVSDRKRVIFKVFAGGGCVISLIFSSLIYAFVKGKTGVTTLDAGVIANCSCWIFVATFVSGAACIFISKAD